MYDEPLVTDYDHTVASGKTPQTYNLISFPSGNASVRKNVLVDDGTVPETMKVSHQVVGKGTAVRDRHLVRFEQSSDDGDGNIATTTPAVAYVVLDIPRQNIDVSEVPYALTRQLCGFLRGANADDTSPEYTTNLWKLLNGEM